MKRPAGKLVLSGVLGALLVAAGALAGETQALDWLVRMSAAVEKYNYTGTFLHLAGSDSRTMQVVHRAQSTVSPAAERLLALDGPPREVLREAQVTRCILPAQRTVVMDEGGESPLASALPDDNESLERLYRIAFLGAERVAGRPVVRLAVRPIDRYRFGYQFWLDEQTALPLKTVTLGEHGRVVELIHFTQIDFPDAIADEALTATLPSEGFRTVQASPVTGHELEGETAWRAQHLPAGFRLSMATRERSATGTDTEHLVYSDGLASVSVFIEHTGVGSAKQRPNFAEFGAASAYSRTLGAYHIVVVGEVPADTVTMIGRSMRRTVAMASP